MGKMRLGWVVLACGVAFACPLGGCLSGQTGSPDCAGPVSCICDPLYAARTLLRVRVERVEAGRLEAIVDEVFSKTYGTSELVVGDKVTGSVLAQQPCAGVAPTLQVGSELFVLYSPGVFSWAVPWAETLSFGGSTELSSSEVSVLSTPESCQERFPPEPAPPCDDTPSGWACSAAPHATGSGIGYGALLFALAASVRGLRRRARP